MVHPFGMPEDHPRSFVLQVEEIERAAELAVVALFGLFEAMQVQLEVVFFRPRGAVDPLQHFVARIAAPVRAGQLGELEHLELAGRGHVRAAAQVGEPALAVERDVFVGRDRGDDLRLVVLADRLEELDRLVARHELARHRLVLFRELGHALLDRRQVFRRERPLVGKIVVEAVFDHRADGHLRVREELLDRVGEQVRGGVAQHLEAVRILVGDDGEARVAVDHEGRIDELAVDPAGERGLGKSGPDRGRDLGHGDRRIEVFDGAVG